MRESEKIIARNDKVVQLRKLVNFSDLGKFGNILLASALNSLNSLKNYFEMRSNSVAIL